MSFSEIRQGITFFKDQRKKLRQSLFINLIGCKVVDYKRNNSPEKSMTLDNKDGCMLHLWPTLNSLTLDKEGI